MKIRKDDTVIVIAGKQKGTIAKVLRALPSKDKVVVEGVNIVTRSMKKQGTTPGQQIKFEKPIDVSNVAFYCEETKKGTRIGFEDQKGKKVRVKKSTGKAI